MKTSDMKFKIDFKKLETGKPVRIGENLYAKKLADSIEIYEIKPLEITLEDKESILEAVKIADGLYDLLKEKLPPIERLKNSLYEKYCKNCLEVHECLDRYYKNEATCELSPLIWHMFGDMADSTDILEEVHEERRQKEAEAELKERGVA